MNDYEQYVKEVNNIFSILEKLKNSWTNNDNLNHIEEINEYRKIVIRAANFLEEKKEMERNEI